MKKGDRVMVLDDNLEGIILKIEGNNAYIETLDGFKISFSKKELVLLQNPLSSSAFSAHNISEILKEKTYVKKINSKRKKPKERTHPAMEVDLHIHHLVKNQKSLSNYEMLEIQLDTAKRQLLFAMNKGIQRVVFIHGIGAGVLRQELEYLFNKYEAVSFEDANFQKYGRGATEVFIHQSKL